MRPAAPQAPTGAGAEAMAAPHAIRPLTEAELGQAGGGTIARSTNNLRQIGLACH
jgi:hypothetical protein